MSEIPDEMVAKYSAMLDQCHKLEEEYPKIRQAVLFTGAKVLFARHPDLESFGWRQYTPTFNDGAPCTLRCNCDEPNINGEHWDDRDETTETYAEEVADFLCSFGESFLTNVFGDGVSVEISRTGITTENYNYGY